MPLMAHQVIGQDKQLTCVFAQLLVGLVFWPSHLQGLRAIEEDEEEDENQLAAARKCRWSQVARISMKCQPIGKRATCLA